MNNLRREIYDKKLRDLVSTMCSKAIADVKEGLHEKCPYNMNGIMESAERETR